MQWSTEWAKKQLKAWILCTRWMAEWIYLQIKRSSAKSLTIFDSTPNMLSAITLNICQDKNDEEWITGYQLQKMCLYWVTATIRWLKERRNVRDKILSLKWRCCQRQLSLFPTATKSGMRHLQWKPAKRDKRRKGWMLQAESIVSGRSATFW